MFMYIMKQNIRSNIKLMKNYGLTYLCLIIAVIMGFSFMTSMGVDLRIYIVQISITIAVIGAYYIFFGKFCCLRMHPATFQHTFNTNRFIVIKSMCAVKAYTNVVFLWGLLIFIINIVALSEIDWFYSISLLLFMSACMILKWLKYKTKSAKGMIVVLSEFSLSCAGFIIFVITENPVGLLIQAFAMLCTFLHNSIQKADWGRFLKDSTYTNFINYAGNNKDMALMQQIVTERTAEKKRIVSLCDFPLKQSNAVFFKAIIEFMRVEKFVILLFFGLIVLGLSIRTLGILPNLPIENMDLGHIISAFFVTGFINFISETFSQNLASISEKQRNGFMLPYSNKKIITSYLMAAGIIVTAFYIIIPLLHQASLIRIIIVIPLANLITLISLYLANKSKKKKGIIKFIINTAFYALSLLVV